ncbi:hypothetical protein C1701_14145 [Actinoalloteichus sp. AHMU CJ021]|uniref:hypothetical protein n=1 Tax=Actinoalloteichus TaxID=65496 RepID=UPI00041AF516|nr:hypothetical protein [Actinoalloteichus caeruleus]AUS79316.1 hypothetical protein C1701_14145 [Actinoalloteichus sp. AHMU CJ021]
MNENNHSALSFDRMRSMLTRAAEIRDSEQQQVFDALDEIHARLSPLESLGSVRKRLSELPDRTEVSVLAERLDEALSKLESQDTAISGLLHAVDGLVDKLAKPFAQLDGRLDGVSGRFDGVAGRMDGLEDRLGHIHKRLDDLGLHLDKQDTRLENMPAAVHGPVRERMDGLELSLRSRIDEVDEGVHEHLDGTKEALQRHVTESAETVRGEVTSSSEAVRASVETSRETLGDQLRETRDEVQRKLDSLLERPAVDPTEKLDALAERLEQLSRRVQDVNSRVEKVDDSVLGRIGELNDAVDTRLREVDSDVLSKISELNRAVETHLDRIDGTLADRPDTGAVNSMVREANAESERRNATQLDEAMATFAELILGGAPTPPPPPTPLPRQQRRATRKGGKGREGEKGDEADAIESA